MFTAEIEGAVALATDWVNVRAAVRAGMRRGVKRGVEEGAAEARAKHAFKNRTGELERSITGRLLGFSATEHRGVIVAAKSYASYVEYNTRPHEIRVRKAKWLRWVDDDGAVHFAKRVFHPGTKGQPFMHWAYYKAERVIIREIEIAIVQAQAILDR